MSRLTRCNKNRIECNIGYCPEDCNTCGMFNDIRKKLSHYEDLEEQGLLLELPCKVGDEVYTLFSMSGWHFRKKDRPYKGRIVFIGINGVDDFMNVEFGRGKMLQFHFSHIGENVFLTKEEAEVKLKELEEGVE